MPKQIIFTSAVLVLVAAQEGTAQSSKAPQTYGGIGLGFIELVDEIFPPQEFPLAVIHGRVGTRFNEYFSSELRVGFGVSEGTASPHGAGGNIEVNARLRHAFGIYGLMHVPLAAPLTPYAVFGYNRSKVRFNSMGDRWIFGVMDLSIGVGVDWDLGNGGQFNAEYRAYFKEDRLDLDGFLIGVVFDL